MSRYSIEITEHQLEYFHQHLAYVRCWAQGFEAAGKSGPHAIDTLRQIQNVLKTAKPAKSKAAK